MVTDDGGSMKEASIADDHFDSYIKFVFDRTIVFR